MGVEFIGFMIVIGVMIVVIIRRQVIAQKMKENKNLEDSTVQLQLQLEEVANSVIERVENRINHLELLVAEADDKIGALDEKMKQLAALEASAAERKAQIEIMEKIAAEKKERERAKDEALRLKADAAQETAADAAALAQPKEATSTGVKAQRFKESKTNQRVMKLLSEGRTLDEVAKETGMGKGAIVLIREMYK